MTQETLIHMIAECVKDTTLSYNNTPPECVSPGVWKFPATEMSDKCTKGGQCRERYYYAYALGNSLKLC